MNTTVAEPLPIPSLGLGIELVERGLVPDFLIRWGIRRICQERIDELYRGTTEEQWSRQEKFIATLRTSPIAEETAAANAQHYEVPAEFFSLVMGKYRKYSSCVFPEAKVAGVPDDLSLAEERMLKLTAERAEVVDGMEILDLGCGWGSMSLFLAERYPNAKITGVSNSQIQRRFIEKEIADRKLTNLRIVTADANTYQHPTQVDRVISIEMFEHMRNYQELLRRVSTWLKPTGKLFVHIFVHREYAYPYETEGHSNWLGRYFFTGGTMPSDRLLYHFQENLRIQSQWRVSGTHYQRTAECWYENHLKNRQEIMEIFRSCYGEQEAKRWYNRWKVFFLACAELWGYRCGSEWFVTHYLFSKPSN